MVVLVSTGYYIALNASEYEFDVNVYSPVGTVVFEALLIAENVNDLLTVGVNFAGRQTAFGPYSINGMDTEVTFDAPITSSPLLTIRLDETLDPNDDQDNYTFFIDYVVAGITRIRSQSVNVILHELIGEFNI